MVWLSSLNRATKCVLKKGSDPLPIVVSSVNVFGWQRVRPLFQQSFDTRKLEIRSIPFTGDSTKTSAFSSGRSQLRRNPPEGWNVGRQFDSETGVAVRGVAQIRAGRIGGNTIWNKINLNHRRRRKSVNPGRRRTGFDLCGVHAGRNLWSDRLWADDVHAPHVQGRGADSDSMSSATTCVTAAARASIRTSEVVAGSGSSARGSTTISSAASISSSDSTSTGSRSTCVDSVAFNAAPDRSSSLLSGGSGVSSRSVGASVASRGVSTTGMRGSCCF